MRWLFLAASVEMMGLDESNFGQSFGQRPDQTVHAVWGEWLVVSLSEIVDDFG